ncbi:hypothetical protein [Halocatena halophila]|uniref:hypothetical protein n=1 Tax=Halocatena halophila TaxID=2814576 RepID=UPI002ED161F3
MVTLDTLRSQAYTGPNRCWPCTIFNIIVLGFVTASIGYVLGPLVAVPLAVVGGAVVWLRGYLFPGTPYFGSYIAARLPLDVFHPERPISTPDPITTTNDIDPAALVDSCIKHGIVRECDGQIGLARAFREQWRREIRTVRGFSDDALTSNLEAVIPWVKESEFIEHQGSSWIVLSAEGQRVEKESWLTVVIATAELAAVRALRNYAPDMDHRRRIVAVPSLRSFLERCPMCETPIEKTSVDSCCGSPQRIDTESEHVLACPECDEIIADTAQMNERRVSSGE